MKKHAFVLVLLAMLVMALPAAAQWKEPVGGRIDILAGEPDQYPAGEPFHIQHGNKMVPGDPPPGRFDFKLEVDGVLQQEDYVDHWVDLNDPEPLVRIWVFNFPEGMTGTRTFTGHWYISCRWAVNNGWYTGDCRTPHALVEILSQPLTVEFVEP
jgi:hypothetical protein